MTQRQVTYRCAADAVTPTAIPHAWMNDPLFTECAGMVMAEVARSSEQHPFWPKTLGGGYCIVAEECGELAKAIVDYEVGAPGADRDAIAEEALQTAAMALRFLYELARERTGMEACPCNVQAMKGDQTR